MTAIERVGAPRVMCLALASLVAASAAGCAPWYRSRTDQAASRIIGWQQEQAFGERREFSIEPPAETLRRRLLLAQDLPMSDPASLSVRDLPTIPHWPEKDYPASVDVPDETADLVAPPDRQAMQISMVDALRIAAQNNRTYQDRKEEVFQAALNLDLESEAFRSTFRGTLDTLVIEDLRGEDRLRGWENTANAGWRLRLTTGAQFTANLAVDLVKLLVPRYDSGYGIMADASVTVPLLRGAGVHVVTEPMTQAQRNVLYALHRLEGFRKDLVVQVATDYLNVLRQLDQVANQEASYIRLIRSRRSAQALAKGERWDLLRVDQARQDELRARDRWIQAQQSYARALDRFKLSLGLPVDAEIELDRGELERLGETVAEQLEITILESLDDESVDYTDEFVIPPVDAPVKLEPPTRDDGGPYELDPQRAVRLAFQHRLDLRTALGRVFDAQRRVTVAANALEAGLTLRGDAAVGERRGFRAADRPNVDWNPRDGLYTAGLILDLPLDRTAEAIAYRNSYIRLQQAVRDAQQAEDQIKLEVRSLLRDLIQFRESLRIQVMAVDLAERRLDNSQEQLQAGRAEVRDVLDAQEALVSAQNARTAALVNYRVAELQLQRDMGVLQVDDKGLWIEYDPNEPERITTDTADTDNSTG